MSTDDFLKIAGGIFGTAFTGFVLNLAGVLQFGRVDGARAKRLHVANEISISKQSLEWLSEFKARLDKQTEQLDIIRKECDVLREDKIVMSAHLDILQENCNKLIEENELLKKENAEMRKRLEDYIKKYG